MISRFERFRMVPMFLIMGTIFFLSHQPGDSLEMPSIPGIDKFAHLFIYAVLAVTVLIALKPSWRCYNPKGCCLITVGVCLAYGMSDELHQYFIPGRFVSGWDLFADVFGALLVSTAWYCRTRQQQSHR